MSFWRRFLSEITGQASSRLARQMAALGAPPDLVSHVKKLSIAEQEAAFITFAEGKHACLLDWRASGDDVLEALAPLLTPRERDLLPSAENWPRDARGTIVILQRSFRSSERRLIHVESFGDFSFLILVPGEKEQELLEAAGPWLIAADRNEIR